MWSSMNKQVFPLRWDVNSDWLRGRESTVSSFTTSEINLALRGREDSETSILSPQGFYLIFFQVCN